MPHVTQSITESDRSAPELLAIAYGCFHQLGWVPEFASDVRLVGYTKKSWNKNIDHIYVDVEEGMLSITSALPDDALWDPMKKNKKNVNRFLEAWASQQT